MTSIGWTHGPGFKGITWNPVTGCDRTSTGCDRCYALTMAGRLKLMGNPKYQNDGNPRTSGPGFGVTFHPDVLKEPRRWRAPRMVFVCSMSDLFHPAVPSAFIHQAFDEMADASQHVFQVLTKRPERMAQFCRNIVDWHGSHVGTYGTTLPLGNLWTGTSIENDLYTFRARQLRSVPARVRFLSLEPLLAPLPSLDLTGIHWVIIGGESGAGAREMDSGWAADLIDRCADAGVPVYMKQMGAVWARRWSSRFDPKGEDWSNWPEKLRRREWPAAVTAPAGAS